MTPASLRFAFERCGRVINMPEYHVTARRIDAHGSEATTKETRIVLDTGTAGRADAFNPAELLLANLAACTLKGAERGPL